MRLTSLLVTVSLAFLSPAVLAQQPSETTGDRAVGDAIGHPPPLPSPPPISQTTSTAPPAPAASSPGATEPAPKGYTGAYAPAGSPPPTPYSTGPLPDDSGGPGLNKVASDGVSTRTVKAAPCGTAARETDGFTTCVGIPDQPPSRRRPRH
jgi:hypothetical protein